MGGLHSDPHGPASRLKGDPLNHADKSRIEAQSMLDQFLTLGVTESTMEFWQGHLPDDEAHQRGLADAFDRIGVDAFNNGNPTGARDAFWPLFLLRLAILKQHPSDRAAIRDFASSEDLLGLALLSLGNLEPSEEMLSEALSYRRGLFSDDSSDAHAAYLYGVALAHMSQLARAKRDPVAEAKWARQARDHLTEVNAAWPGVSLIADELAAVQSRLAEM
jgi:hypothetical protein